MSVPRKTGINCNDCKKRLSRDEAFFKKRYEREILYCERCGWFPDTMFLLWFVRDFCG